MAKSGQARVLTAEQFQNLICEIEKHRHPEKNSCIMHISFKLGLRAQEIALLQIKEVAKLIGPANARDYKLLDIMSLPASYTKGSNATGAKVSNSSYKRRSVSFKVEEFDNVVAQITALAKAGAEVDPKQFYPFVEKRSGVSRDLPMSDMILRQALTRYIDHRINKAGIYLTPQTHYSSLKKVVPTPLIRFRTTWDSC